MVPYCGNLLLPQLNRTEGSTLELANALWPAAIFAVHEEFAAKARALLAQAHTLDYQADVEAATQDYQRMGRREDPRAHKEPHSQRVHLPPLLRSGERGFTSSPVC